MSNYIKPVKISKCYSVFRFVERHAVCGRGTCADTLDGRMISDVERQFLKNWKAVRQPQLRLMAPPVDSSCVSDSPRLSAGTAKASVSSAGTPQQSMIVARQSVSEPSRADMSVVPCSPINFDTKQPLYYDSEFPVFCVCYVLEIFALIFSAVVWWHLENSLQFFLLFSIIFLVFSSKLFHLLHLQSLMTDVSY